MSLVLSIILLPAGIAILVKGADWLVDGAIAISERLGLSPLIIGLTVVAMGTSAPEVAASIAASLNGSGDIAVGNVYGSNIANLALVGGLCALIRPIVVHRAALHRDIPLMLASTLVLWPTFHDSELTRIEAAGLLLFFALSLIFTVYTESRQITQDKRISAEIEKQLKHTDPCCPKSFGISVLYIFLGLVCLAAGAHLTVLSASALGRTVGISEAVIGLTVVALGTSLPEMTTCLVATFKGHDDLSIGNLVGSNIFNALLVIGASGTIKPFHVSHRISDTDFWPMAAFSAAFACFAFISQRISRTAGFVLGMGYLGYMVYLFFLNR